MPISLIQKVLGTKNRQYPEQKLQQTQTTQSKEKVWFDMYLIKDGKQIDKSICHEGIIYPSIDIGQTYTLVVLGSNIPSNFHANHIGLEFSTMIKVRIQCIANTQILIDEERQITSTEASVYRQEFSLPIDEAMPTCELILRMDIIIAEDAMRSIGVKTLFIRGAYEVISQQFLCQCQLATELPHNVSILSIIPHPDQKYQFGFMVEGWNTKQRLSTLQYQNQTMISVQQYIQAKIDPSTIRVKIRRLSQYMRLHEGKKLSDWLTWLEETYGEDCYLIIEDESALEIPWEMLELQDDYHYLGAAIKVVRWISTGIQSIANALEVHAYTYQGSVISYLDNILKEEETAAERIMLQRLQIEEYSDLNSLKQRFKKTGTLTNVGLIYIGAHGEAGNRLYLASQNFFTADHLTLMSKHAYPRPLAFFNACESARLGRIGTFDNNSFVVTLLERIVQGYIGTLAVVGSREASVIAHRFLSMAYNNPDMTIAAILQQIRKKAAQNLQQGFEKWSDDDPKEKALELTFLYTFMYVYYGNPLARLMLKPRNSNN